MQESDHRYKVDRPTQSDHEIQEKLGLEDEGEGALLLGARRKIANACLCSKSCCMKWIAGVFPILSWLRAYEKSWIAGDLVAGLTVGVVHIPQSELLVLRCEGVPGSETGWSGGFITDLDNSRISSFSELD